MEWQSKVFFINWVLLVATLMADKYFFNDWMEKFSNNNKSWRRLLLPIWVILSFCSTPIWMIWAIWTA